ncbi:MAG: 8-amino-7-oxononanoate synthase [Mariprofundales bacterium]
MATKIVGMASHHNPQQQWFADLPPSARRLLRPTLDPGTICFSSNDYLGLRDDPRIVQAATDILAGEGLGSGGSRLVCGDHPLWHQLERELADWLGFEAALVVGSGMLGNMGLIPALADRHTTLFSDRLNHASLIDGARLSGATVRRYRHRDLQHLAQLLAQADATKRRIIVSDGLFSMDGDGADVAALLALAERFDALLLLDDAHGIGTMGQDGRGLAAAANVSGHPRLVMSGTLGKAFGGYGAFVLAQRTLIDGLIQRLRTLIYSTALPPLLAAAALAALKVMRSGERLAPLKENMRYFAQRAGIAVVSPIIPWHIGDDGAALAASDALATQGLRVVAIRPPTVPKGSARLRITLSARHTAAQIDPLITALCHAGLDSRLRGNDDS